MRKFSGFAYVILWTIVLTCCIQVLAEPPAINQSDLIGLVGEWTGEVTHYKITNNDTVRTVSPAVFSADTSGGLVVSRMVYDAPNGENMVDWGEWSVSPTGRTIRFNQETMWFVSGKNVTDNGMTLVFQARGTDDVSGNPAQIVNVLYIGHQDSMIYAQKVLPDYAGREQLRREFRLGRIKE